LPVFPRVGRKKRDKSGANKKFEIYKYELYHIVYDSQKATRRTQAIYL
jgi:hypothetical protein